MESVYLNFINLSHLAFSRGKYRVGKVKFKWDDWKTGTPNTREYLRLDPCAYCGGIGGTIDHIYPRCPRRKLKGGLKTGFDPFHWTNYTGACERCNTKKDNMHLLEFLVNYPLGGKH